MGKLYGVSHDVENLDELSQLIRELEYQNFQSASLELPDDYLELREQNMGIFFFGVIGKYLEEKGTKIFSLDPPELMDEVYTLIDSIAIKKGEYDISEVNSELRVAKKKVDDNFVAPEVRFRYKRILRRNPRILELTQNGLRVEELESMLMSVHKKRDEVMLERINEINPELVVVGLGHAREIKNKLTNYEYIDFTKVIYR